MPQPHINHGALAVDEVREHRRRCELLILQALQEFYKQTGLFIRSAEFMQEHAIGSHPGQYGDVKLRIDL